MAHISGNQIRSLVLQASKKANVGHIGSALSIADIIAVLFEDIIQGLGSSSPDRDRFVLSKGHAALAVYAALFLKGILTAEEFGGYCQNGTLLGTHPEHSLKGIDFSTGSLGQGLSIGVGAALAAQLSQSNRKVYILISDAECNEGSLWEGVMFAGHHNLSGVTVIVDFNGQQATGYTKDVLNQENMADRWRAFGWDVLEVNGHNPVELDSALHNGRTAKPRVVIARTQAGHGVSFMEQQISWHYMPMTDTQFDQAMTEVNLPS